MKFIKKHLTAIIIIFVCIVLLVLAAFAVYRMFYPSDNKSVYGDRLNNAPDIDSLAITKIKEEILATELVETFEYELNVKTMKFYIDVKQTTKINKAQDLSDIIIENLSEEVTNFYDISIYLTQKTKEYPEYPAIGYHSKGAKVFNWVINKEVEESED